jgi:hypothetical protein
MPRVVILVLVMSAACASSAPVFAAIRPKVSPPVIMPTERPLITFVADRRLAGNVWYEVTIRAVRAEGRCERREVLEVTYAFPGQRIRLRPRAWDRGKWCLGAYRGLVRLISRVHCFDEPEDNFGCFALRPAARFRFQVALGG